MHIERVNVEKPAGGKAGMQLIHGNPNRPETWTDEDGWYRVKFNRAVSIGHGIIANAGDVVEHVPGCIALQLGDKGHYPRVELLGSSPKGQMKVTRAEQPPAPPKQKPDDQAVQALVSAGDALRTLAASLKRAAA